MVRSPHNFSEGFKTLLDFQLAKTNPKFVEELQNFMVDNILGLEFRDPEPPIEKLYEKPVKWLKNRESIGLGPKGKVESAVFIAQLEKRVNSNQKLKEMKRSSNSNSGYISYKCSKFQSCREFWSHWCEAKSLALQKLWRPN